VPDASDEADYIAARTPAASVVLNASAGGSGGVNSSVAKALSAGRALTANSLAATIQPVIANGASTIVSLAPSAPAPSASPASQSAASSAFKIAPAKTARPGAASASAATVATTPLAVVTLSYGVACAGQTVAVCPLSGGVVSSTDSAGNVSSASSQLLLTLDTTGALTFGFQAPAAAKTYQVFTRLDNVATTFTFTVPDPGS
jgi:hypothetical protein